MDKPQLLQKFGHQDSAYERPSQKWLCGKYKQGCPCEIGPDKHGKCRADFQCKPKVNEAGDSWKCTRSGGSCADGPLPDGTCCQPITHCQPVRSIRYKRSITLKSACTVALGLLIFFIYSGNSQNFLSPGELTYQHAKNADCIDCHEVFNKGVSGWVHQAFNAVNMLDNNAQCLSCHQFNESANYAHGLPEAELKAVAFTTEADKSNPIYQEIACMTCHIEHHGTNNSLLTVNSQNCAVCHDLPFNITGKVHPDFRHYPYRKRTGIIFDHSGHYEKHFFDKSGENRRDDAPSSCLTCHVSDKDGIKMDVRDFQGSCQACHNSSFEESESFAVMTVPALNTDDLNGTSWLEDADAEITPFMKLLLADDNEKLSDVISNLESDDLTELEADDSQVIAWGIKEFYYDIYKNGKKSLKKQLSKAFRCQLNQQGDLVQEPICKLTVGELNAMLNKFPWALFCSAQKEWFPQLMTEMALYQSFQGNNQRSTSSQSPFCTKINKKTSSAITEQGSWSFDYFTIGYRAKAHTDDFFKVWLDATRRHQGTSITDTARKEIYELLTSKDSAGQCNYCHSIDSDEADNYVINWSTPKWNPKHKDFIHFNHAGHLRHQEESVCETCHIRNKEADYLASYKNNKPLQFESGFSTGKAVCETCHEKAMTENQCQTCHNYHVTGINSNIHLEQNPMGKGKLKLWADMTDYKIGDEIVIKFSVDRPMYVRIVRTDSAGKILSLFPNEFRPDHYCKPNVVYQIPEASSERTLIIAHPTGINKVYGIGSDEPIPENKLFFNQQGNFDEEKMKELTIRSTFVINVE